MWFWAVLTFLYPPPPPSRLKLWPPPPVSPLVCLRVSQSVPRASYAGFTHSTHKERLQITRCANHTMTFNGRNLFRFIPGSHHTYLNIIKTFQTKLKSLCDLSKSIISWYKSCIFFCCSVDTSSVVGHYAAGMVISTGERDCVSFYLIRRKHLSRPTISIYVYIYLYRYTYIIIYLFFSFFFHFGAFLIYIYIYIYIYNTVKIIEKYY